MPPLTLLSCGVESESRLPRSTQWELWAEWADCVYGSAKLLALFPGFQAKGIVLGADARAKAQEALEASRNGKRVLILGSGDVLFHGIGGTLYDLAGDEDELCFIPAETAFQTLPPPGASLGQGTSLQRPCNGEHPVGRNPLLSAGRRVWWNAPHGGEVGSTMR